MSHRAARSILVGCALLLAGPIVTRQLRAQPVQRRQPVRLALLIGQDIGSPRDQPLRFAERDARRMREILTALGDVAPERALLLLDATADRVSGALRELRGRAAELRATGREPILLVYVSSHADAGALRLEDTRLSYSELRRLVGEVPALVRLVIVDACDSGALIRRKGARRVVPYRLDLDAADSVAGQVLLTSAGAGEPAQEWDALGGSLFTHHLMSALRGAADLDGDGRITLFEAYAYTYERTVVTSTQARAGMQHPSHEIELRGKGDLVLTRPARHSSALVLPPGDGGRYVVTTALGGELVAAVDASPRRAVRLALPPGRYLVRRPTGAFVQIGEVVITPRATTTLDDSEMEQVPYAQVARRGADSIHPYAIEVGAVIASGALDGQSLGPRLSLGLRRERGPWELAVGVELGQASFRGRSLDIEQRELFAHLSVRWRLPLGWLLPYLGARAGAGLIHQSLVRDQEDVIQDVLGKPPIADKVGGAGTGHVLAGVEVPLSLRTGLRAEAQGGAIAPRLESGWQLRPAIGFHLSGLWRW
jgi:Caspase domain